MFEAEITAKDLNAVIRKLSSLTRVGTIPVLNHAWLRFQDGHLKATTTTLDETITASIPASGSGSLTVDVGRLSAFAKYLPADAIITMKPGAALGMHGTLECRSGAAVHSIPSFTESEFPVIVAADIVSDLSWTVDSGWLKECLSAASPVMETGTMIKPFLHGMHVEFGPEPYLNAAETFGLFRCEAKWFKHSEVGAFMLPSEAIKLASEILLDDTAVVSLSKEKNAALISCGYMTVRTKLVETKFPDHKAYFPSETEATFFADSQTLLKTLSLGSIPGIRDNRIEVALAGDSFMVSSSASDRGSATDECQIFDYMGKPQKFKINGNNLRWAIDSLKCETVTAQVAVSQSKIVFTKNGDPSSVRLAMMYG